MESTSECTGVRQRVTTAQGYALFYGESQKAAFLGFKNTTSSILLRDLEDLSRCRIASVLESAQRGS